MNIKGNQGVPGGIGKQEHRQNIKKVLSSFSDADMKALWEKTGEESGSTKIQDLKNVKNSTSASQAANMLLSYGDDDKQMWNEVEAYQRGKQQQEQQATTTVPKEVSGTQLKAALANNQVQGKQRTAMLPVNPEQRLNQLIQDFKDTAKSSYQELVNQYRREDIDSLLKGIQGAVKVDAINEPTSIQQLGGELNRRIKSAGLRAKSQGSDHFSSKHKHLNDLRY